MAARHTPVMQQHAAAKRAHPDAVVFFRLGDFYEMFGDDAVIAARELDLTLTSRNKGAMDEVPMAGVPHHSAHGYIARLLDKGYRVALCEQMADPAKCKGIVPREVVRVITPGVVTDRDYLKSATNNWLAALEINIEGVGLALLDLSTGELRATEVRDVAHALAELSRARPREVLLAAFGETASESAHSVERVVSPARVTSDGDFESPEALGEALGELEREAGAIGPRARMAVARVLRFGRRCAPGKELPVRSVGRWDPSEHLILDATAQAHLELVESVSGGKDGSLLSVVDLTRTPAGARLMRRRLLAPLKEVAAIRRRLDGVETFVVHERLRDALRDLLSGVGDLERLAQRAALRESNPRDLGATRDGLLAASKAAALLVDLKDEAQREVLGVGSAPLDCVEDIGQVLSRALVERPPAQSKEGAIFLTGFDPELDEYDELRRTGTERMVQLEAELRQLTQIPSLKLRFTRVFGWYVEVSRSQLGRVPKEWRRKQTVASGERYTTVEVDDLADRIAHAEERHRERELLLLKELVETVARASERIRALSAVLAQWDVSAALAALAHRFDYCRPEVDDSDALEIRDGRHPVVERLAGAGHFVPNDVTLDVEKARLWLVTGPNMAGKSTLLRQVALITILAQMGSYVPAASARVGVVDRVLSRVGASDNVARGESTFMVEMRETSEILRSATDKSLVILDEIGRGTSTFDGLAIAWGVAEHLHDVIGCRAMFATHYHELTVYAESAPYAENWSVSARELGQEVVFLHRLVHGAASRSYGVAVARLAGLPEMVLARARALLEQLERGEVAVGRSGAAMPEGKTTQLDLFQERAVVDAEREVLQLLRHAELDRVSPLEALQLLARLKGRLGTVNTADD
jgi:DNA mismatch repair protein MutS